MALLDFLKQKKEIKKSKDNKSDKKSVDVKVEKAVKKEEKIASEKSAFKSNKKAGSFSYSVIKEPHISEKASDLAEKQNQYVFEVVNGSNKIEIKKAVEGVYGVRVLSVNIIKIPHKKRRIGKTQGFKKAYTKAIVQLKKGDKIEIL
jgi:large subunit ribosomal protein L23